MTRLTRYSVGESAAATLTSLRISVPGCVFECERAYYIYERTLDQSPIYICRTIERLIGFVLKRRIYEEVEKATNNNSWQSGSLGDYEAKCSY